MTGTPAVPANATVPHPSRHASQCQPMPCHGVPRYSRSLLLLLTHALPELLQSALHGGALLGQLHRLHAQLPQVPKGHTAHKHTSITLTGRPHSPDCVKESHSWSQWPTCLPELARRTGEHRLLPVETERMMRRR